jgi:glutamate racemase
MDSGVGGISVLRELIDLMPEENYIYLGDSLNAPYGTKSDDAVMRLSLAHAERLFGLGAKALVVACNTATSVAIGRLREVYPDRPIIGVEPALRPAMKQGGRVLVMATPMTLRREKFHRLLEVCGGGDEVITLPCAGLVEIIERGVLDGDELSAYLKKLFAPLGNKPFNSVVLGCTHYPFIRRAVAQALAKTSGSVTIYDGGKGTAAETKRRLEKAGLKRTATKKGTVELVNTLGTSESLDLMRRFMTVDY